MVEEEGSVQTNSRTWSDNAENIPKDTRQKTAVPKTSLPGYPVIAKTTDYKERWVNIIQKLDGEKEVRVDAACYSHSPPDMPLKRYNRYRMDQFNKSLHNIHAVAKKRIPSDRNTYFLEKYHKRYPHDGSLRTVLCIPSRVKRSSQDGSTPMENCKSSPNALACMYAKKRSAHLDQSSPAQTPHDANSHIQDNPRCCCCCQPKKRKQ